MDISNLISSSAASPASKTGPVVELVKTSASGNSLPAAAQAASHTAGPQEQSRKLPVSNDVLRGLVDKANEAISTRLSNLKFTVAEGTDIAVVRIVDSDTGELIRQIPSEQMVAVSRALEDLTQGMLLKEKV